MTSPILVGYDPTTSDPAPVEFAVAAAGFTGAPLIVLSVQAGAPLLPVGTGTGSVAAVLGQPDIDLVADCTQALAALEASCRQPASARSAASCRARARPARCTRRPRRRTPACSWSAPVAEDRWGEWCPAPTPGTSRKIASGFQKHPAPNVATSDRSGGSAPGTAVPLGLLGLSLWLIFDSW